MDITVIVPTSNRAHLLNKTLSSLAEQTNSEFKVYVVDHGSTDDTREVCQQYEQKLCLEYIWLEKSREAPGAPRHFGMEKVDTPIAVFLDCGVIVPSFYIKAQLHFHQTHPHHVGIGYYHGHCTAVDQSDTWPVLLEHLALDQAEKAIEQLPSLADERSGVQLPDAFRWMHGWTGNLSLLTEDYRAVGGFDAELGYALEDVELSYRLLKHGVQFAVVENGWGIHLPHPRPPARVRRRTQYMAWQYCYHKHRTLAIEVMLYSGMNPEAIAQTFHYLGAVGRCLTALPAVAPLAASYQFSRPSLLIGGTKQDASFFDYLALADEAWASDPALWSCSGIRIPLPDRALQSVVVSDIWRWLGFSFNASHISLLECMIADIRRTARRAYFMDSSSAVALVGPSLSEYQEEQTSTPASPLRLSQRQQSTGERGNLLLDQEEARSQAQPVSVSYLEQLCHKYDLPFEIVVPE